ncbi:MAG: SGNH/GDSL hydrolase family protein [Bacilli bacterium]|nr:SGNH/GDSL hydrolase family protein [Bacilli bacterium]
MTRLIKLIILIILSSSVYFIYNITKESKTYILNLGDGLCEGINSYGIKEYGYSDYYLMRKTNKNISLKKHCSKEMSIDKMINLIKTNSQIKKDLMESHHLIINLGYNDLFYRTSITENMNIYKMNYIVNNTINDYNDLITEIKKYYDNKILIIGYYKSKNSYLNYGIKQLNNYLKSNKSIIYLDTYYLLSDYQKYFSNPNSYYPNNKGYMKIATKITKKLEK